jgi:hypothetical protein
VKIKKTVLGVGLFVILLIAFFGGEAYAGTNHTPDRSHFVSIGVSGGVVNYSGGVTQKLGYTYGNQRWRTEFERMGGGSIDSVNFFSLVRHVKTNLGGLGLSLGVTYSDGLLEDKDRPGLTLVSDRLSYRLGVDYTWTLSSSTDLVFDFVHNSTAGRSKRNSGIDRVGLTFRWRI